MDIVDYYKLKEKYQDTLNARKSRIKNSGRNIKDKQRELKRLVPKCVNCGRPGGTLFEEKSNTLKVSCLAKPPCNLNSVIKRQTYDNLRELDHKNEKLIDNLKMRIIISKLDYLFGFIATKDEAIDKFNVLKNELHEVAESQLIVNKKYADIIGGINRESILNDTRTDLIYQIEQLKEMYTEYNKDPTSQQLGMIMDAYNTVIYPLAEKNRTLSYNHCVVENILELHKLPVYKLVQNTYRMAQLDQERN